LLLLITGSGDGTSDLLVSRLGKTVFRFNYDLFKDYKLAFTSHGWTIENPAGHFISSETVTTAFWWKAFNFYLLDQEKFIEEEVKYVFREIYHWCRLRGLVRGNPHDYHNHMGKMNILSIAKNYFSTPKTLACFALAGKDMLEESKVVAKSFTSGLTTTNKALFTTEVDLQRLDPSYPWFLQELIISESDETVFVCGENLFAFRKSRANLKGLDWRKEQDFENLTSNDWSPFDLTSDEFRKTSAFLKNLGVNWGRLDFMRRGRDLIFLEFNANGQWVFLDYQDKYGLLDTVVEYLTKPSIDDRRPVS
jgi:hypothetical protein